MGQSNFFDAIKSGRFSKVLLQVDERGMAQQFQHGDGGLVAFASVGEGRPTGLSWCAVGRVDVPQMRRSWGGSKP